VRLIFGGGHKGVKRERVPPSGGGKNWVPGKAPLKKAKGQGNHGGGRPPRGGPNILRGPKGGEIYP